VETVRDTNGTFHVLVNPEEQHSLWPTFVPVPAGWRVAQSAAGQQECLNHIEEHWTDLRPRSLRLAMEQTDPHR
jgi:MbtH protein